MAPHTSTIAIGHAWQELQRESTWIFDSGAPYLC